MDSDIEIIDELEEKQPEFVPGWVAREEPDQEGSSSKGKTNTVLISEKKNDNFYYSRLFNLGTCPIFGFLARYNQIPK